MTLEELEIQRARKREACKRYAERYPERRKEQYRRSNKKTYLKNREKRLSYAKVYRAQNREHVNAKSKECRIRNIEIYRKRKREYYHRRKELVGAYQRTKEARYKISKSLAIRRGLEWNISESDYFELISKRCHYRNHPLGISNGVCLDRVDNSKGYVIGNVVPCCGNCNRIKCHLLTYQEMVAIGKLLDQMSFQRATEGVF